MCIKKQRRGKLYSMMIFGVDLTVKNILKILV
jgi:hypothetical protein